MNKTNNPIQERAFNLMKLWCDTLLKYRVESFSPLLNGALLCPACHVIHGRIADLVLPLTLLYVHTNEIEYLNAADSLLNWTDINLSRPDGSVRNDAGSEWKGPANFTAIALGEALYRFGDDLPKDIYQKWMKFFVRISDYVNYVFIPTVKVNINYYAGSACEQAMAWKLTGEERYLVAARQSEAVCHAHFDDDGLLYGEKVPADSASPKGLHFVDIGYNMEESLPLLLCYANLTGEHKEFYRERYRDHMEFMLPDGAIDNSWGSRHNKWTWWGSRTSDGVLSGLALLTDEPLFADACERVLTLYEKCTKNGLLSLPMSDVANEPTCLHHTFCHAKALALLVDTEPFTISKFKLPCEKEYGIKFFQNSNIALVSYKGWRATISSSDVVYCEGCENGGGAMTLLLHDGKPICASTMHKYVAVEPLNMQYLRQRDQTPCMTPRIVFGDQSDTLTDMNATLTKISNNILLAGGSDWSITYTFDDKLTLTIESKRKGTYVLPIVKSGNVVMGKNYTEIGKVVVPLKIFIIIKTIPALIRSAALFGKRWKFPLTVKL